MSGNVKRTKVKAVRKVRAPKKPIPKVYQQSSKKPTKYVDSFNTGTALASPTDASGGELDASIAGPTALGALVGVFSGATETGRIQNDIILTSLQIKGTVTCDAQANQTATDIGTRVFLAVVLDTQTNGVQLSSEDVFTNPSATASLAASPLRNMLNTKRYRVLKIWEMDFNNPSISFDGTNMEQSGMVMPFECYIPMELRVQYNTGNTGIVSGIVDNSLHMIGYTSSTALAPTIQYNCRARFNDE